MPSNTQNVKLGACQVIFDGADLGLTKGGVEVEVTTETYKVEVDQFGKTPIAEVIQGRMVSVKVPLAETTLENLVRTMPGATLTGNGAKATGTITVTTNPVANDTLVVNGVTFTFKASAVLPLDIAIGGTTAVTATNVANVLNASTDPRVTQGDYTVSTNVVTATFEDQGTIGNAFTLAKTGTGITLSGATLTGGTDPTKKKVDVPHGVGQNLLSIAKKLVLHPSNRPSTDRTDDFVIPLAATSGALNFIYKTDEERIFSVTFQAYPDPTTGLLYTFGDETA